VPALLIQAETLDGQIAEARAALAPGAGAARAFGTSEASDAPDPFSRCPECNGELVDISHEEAAALVPPYVWHTQRHFRRCTRCGRVFWKGTHYPGMHERLEPNG
jgi:uncharacterized protein with PIN domain